MYRRGFAEQHPLLTAFLVTMAVGAIFKYWPFFVAVAVVAVLWLLGRRLYRAALRRRTLHAAIAARADYEHRALMKRR
jgi:hypothetical protein